MKPFGTLTVGTRRVVAPTVSGLVTLGQASMANAVLLLEFDAAAGQIINARKLNVFGTIPVGTKPVGRGSPPVRFNYSDKGWVSRPTDSVPNTYFDGRLNSFSLQRSIPVSPVSDRRINAAISVLELNNGDGQFDTLDKQFGIDGQIVNVSLLPKRSSLYSEKMLLFSGVGLSMTPYGDYLKISAVSQVAGLEAPLLKLHLGTGDEEGGLDLKDKGKMKIFGVVRGVTPQLVDAGLYIYRVHDRQIAAFLKVACRGKAATPGTQHATYAALKAATPIATTYDWCITATGTYFKLGFIPDGPVTFDAQGDISGGYVSSVPDMLMRVLSFANNVNLDYSSFAQISARFPETQGIVFADQININDAGDAIAALGWFWWGDTGLGYISIGRLELPTGNSVNKVDITQIIDEVERLEDAPLYYQVTVNYKRNHTILNGTNVVQPPAITPEELADLAQPYQTVVEERPERLLKHAKADKLTIESNFDSDVDARAFANAVLDFFNPDLRMWRLPLWLSAYAFTLGSEFWAEYPRYGLETAKPVRVIGLTSHGVSGDLVVAG